MNLTTLITNLFNDSGLVALYHALPSWLALDQRQLIFVIATPFFIGVFWWEYLKIRGDDKLVNVGESVRNFLLGAGYQSTELLFAGLVSFPVYALAWHHRFMDIQLNWMTGALLFVLCDFCFYWYHRSSHRMRWLWAAHVTHHSSTRMNFSTAMRQNATNIFNGGWLFYVPLALIGFNPVWIGVCYALSLVYQFFIHTTLVTTLHPAIEFVFNTPSHHRVHHGKNADYIDTNYGGVFIVFDRLFGSFTPETVASEYGITRPVESRNLLTLWCHEYVDMFRDMAQPGSLWQRAKHLWMPPEWQRQAMGSDSIADQQKQQSNRV